MTIVERQEWANNPVTQEFLSKLKADKQEAMEAWAMNAFVDEKLNSAALGGVRVLDSLIEEIEEYKNAE